MDILQIVGLGLVATFLVVLLQEQKSSLSFLLTVFVGCTIFLLLVDQISDILLTLREMAEGAHIQMVYLETMLKIIGIAYIAEFAAQISKDAGQGAIAAKIELGGKIVILALAVPILTAIIEAVISLIPAAR
ncbi:stage III sporulation protein AD [Anoxybacillus geothermalis]|uniref:stage III sporulation protein AD n=1 Tax=Geobacillus stearothermophilus TaxID=1422 RepID=UPI000505EDB9|nr:stage III sporulation protein AD [Geobacillus stearothermophilus]AKM19636.1 Stage III sporulation protein AC/AD protein family protein [Geobacillus sp. 12AMOR1]MED4879031.1 stage III sporulation protein AD [Anoxybacillus geothermalis]STO12991.1 stage III sporulation protein AD [[Flavobacterium] thermophilum]KFL16522.1 stage III sporulation protein AD [Geobacillus stearothermophilus]KFX35790.1 stage III sporulation protein AD [Geobacillus stearothermophilus]